MLLAETKEGGDAMAEVKARLSERDQRFLDRSLNDTMWKVVLAVGTPLALYQGLNMVFTILDTMMAAHISKESVPAVAYLSQVNLLLSALGVAGMWMAVFADVGVMMICVLNAIRALMVKK